MLGRAHTAIEQATISPASARRRHVLFLNWRDITHPRAGGAEKVTHEIARRWVAWGHQVTLFCASYPGAPATESIDGVSVVRRGQQQTVHWEAFRYYRRQLRGWCDVIIDEVNTIPFFTPLYAREPVLMYSNQLARNVWRFEAPFPLNMAGYLAEPLYLQAYRHTPVMTISRSTENDLRSLGLAGPYHVIPMSVDVDAPNVLPDMETKDSCWTMVFVGRVVPSKRVDHVVRALGLSRAMGLTQVHLNIVGTWSEKYRRELDRLIATLELANYVTFFGRVDATTKANLLAQAHVVVMTSVREGWGLVVTEANAVGTPAVVYDVAGLRDSTRDGETGLVCKSNTPRALAQRIVALQGDPALYSRLRYQAWANARTLSWDQTARAAWNAVQATL